MSFSYSTGNPSNITGAHAAAMTDIKNSFADIKTYLNGGNLNAASMSPTIFAPYRVLAVETAQILPGDMSSGYTTFLGDYFSRADGAFTSQSPVGINFNPADYALTGKTLKLRLTVSTLFTGGAAGAALVFGLYPVSSIASSTGLYAVTLGSVVSGSTVTRASTSVPDSNYVDSGSDFSAPVAGKYCFGAAPVSLSGTTYCFPTIRLEARWV